MKKGELLRTLTCLFLWTTLVTISYGQQDKIDSLILQVGKAKTEKGVDTIAFNDALGILNSISELSDHAISQLEKTGSSFNKGDDEYWSYVLKLRIFNRLSQINAAKAITYGRKQVELVEESNTPQAVNIRDGFLSGMRVPYRNTNGFDEGFQYYNEKLKEFRHRNDSSGLATCYYVLGGFYHANGLMDQAIYNTKKSLTYMDTLVKWNYRSKDVFQKRNNLIPYLNNLGVLGGHYIDKKDYAQALQYSTLAFKELFRVFNGGNISFTTTIAEASLLSGQWDSVEYYLELGIRSAGNNIPGLISALQLKALYKIKTKQWEEAESILQASWKLIDQYHIASYAPSGTINPDYYLALLRMEQAKPDEAIALLKKDISRVNFIRLAKLRDYRLLAGLYEKVGDHKNSKEAYKSFILLQDSLLADQARYGSISFETEQEMNEKELSIARLTNENRISSLTRNFMMGLATLLLIFGVGLYNRYRFKQKTNRQLSATLSDLKATQAQLIHSEKMASLGELTAGIAHEIQNPLNFVNNFAEVNKELIDEIQEERRKERGVRDEQAEGEILNAVRQNLEKINFYGKRADGIVKSMLQHSRMMDPNRKNKMEPTDINALVDEYLRLAYHGLRAKDNSLSAGQAGFNAALHTDLDESIGMVEVMGQDISRALLNLITNALQAVDEQKKRKQNQGENYTPEVSVMTKKSPLGIEIRIRDNGPGIPENLLDKIFQPFFTTRPAGQGTGLGLSLVFDIVKAHGGEIKVNTEVGTGSEFIIQLPVA